MTLDEYQAAALRTAPRDAAAYPRWMQTMTNDIAREQAMADWDRMVWSMGLAGEAGEVVDYLKKVYGHGHPLDREKVKKELGDVRWYLTVLEHAFGFASSEVAAANIDKLRDRYPNGMTVERSLNRAEESR